MFRIVFLGNTASAPTKSEFTSCFALKEGGIFLFDACEGVQQKMMLYGLSISKVECIFISHLHADHFLGLFGLLQTMKLYNRTMTLKVFGPKGSKVFFSRIFKLRPLSPGFDIQLFDVDCRKERKIFENGLFSVSAFPVSHNCRALGFAIQEHSKKRFDKQLAGSLGIKGKMFSELEKKGKIDFVFNGKKKTVKYLDVTFEQKGKRIVYSGDTAPCNSLTAASKGADLLILDSTFSEGERQHAQEKFHSTALQCAELAKKSGSKKLILTHFSNRYSDPTVLLKEAKDVFDNVELSIVGKEVLV